MLKECIPIACACAHAFIIQNESKYLIIRDHEHAWNVLTIYSWFSCIKSELICMKNQQQLFKFRVVVRQYSQCVCMYTISPVLCQCFHKKRSIADWIVENTLKAYWIGNFYYRNGIDELFRPSLLEILIWDVDHKWKFEWMWVVDFKEERGKPVDLVFNWNLRNHLFVPFSFNRFIAKKIQWFILE